MIKYRRRKTSRVMLFNQWNFDHEIGDLAVDFWGRLFRICESNGRNKAAAGELTPVQIKAPKGTKAKIIDGEIYWVTEEEFK